MRVKGPLYFTISANAPRNILKEIKNYLVENDVPVLELTGNDGARKYFVLLDSNIRRDVLRTYRHLRRLTSTEIREYQSDLGEWSRTISESAVSPSAFSMEH